MPMSYTSKEQPEDKSGFNFMEDIFQPGLQGMAALYNPMMGTGFNPLTAAMGMGGGQQPSVGGILGGGLGGLGGGGTLMADAGNYQVRYPNQQQPQVIDPGSPASGGIQGAASGALKGFVASGLNPAGAIFGGLSGLLS